jgi:hypothetical protein
VSLQVAADYVSSEVQQLGHVGCASSDKEQTEASVDGTPEKIVGNDQEILSVEDVENFLESERMEKETDCAGEATIEEDLKPYLGMKFGTKEEGQKFFNFYSSVVGFSVAIVNSYRTTSKKRNNEITKVVMKCNKHGKTGEVERTVGASKEKHSYNKIRLQS